MISLGIRNILANICWKTLKILAVLDILDSIRMYLKTEFFWICCHVIWNRSCYTIMSQQLVWWRPWPKLRCCWHIVARAFLERSLSLSLLFKIEASNGMAAPPPSAERYISQINTPKSNTTPLFPPTCSVYINPRLTTIA